MDPEEFNDLPNFGKGTIDDMIYLQPREKIKIN